MGRRSRFVARTMMSASVGEGLGSNGFAVARNLDPKLVPFRSLSRWAAKPASIRERRPANWRKALIGSALSSRSWPMAKITWYPAGGWSSPRGNSASPMSPAVTVSDLGEADLRMLRLALNRLGGFKLGRRCLKARVRRRAGDLQRYRFGRQRLRDRRDRRRPRRRDRRRGRAADRQRTRSSSDRARRPGVSATTDCSAPTR